MSIVLVGFSKAKPAQLLASHLSSKGIQASVQADNAHNSSSSQQTESFQVIITFESDLSAAQEIAQDFIQNPNQSKFQESAWQQAAVGIKASNTGLSNTQGWAKLLHELKQTPFTFLVLFLCTIVFVLSALGYFSVIGTWLEIRPINELIETHQWWRILGPNFLHFSLMHIAFNLLWWWMLGRQLELSFGTSYLIIFFFIASVFSNIAQLLVSGPNFGGLSGIVYALVGFVWWIGWLRPTWLISLPSNIIYFLLIWLVLGYLDVLWVSMANEAHTFGLISGCLMALFIHTIVAKPSKKT